MADRFSAGCGGPSGPAALRLWHTLGPDVCLLDVSMDGIGILRRLRAIDPDAKVPMLTNSDAAGELARGLTAFGFHGSNTSARRFRP